jgi:hypothetical protein
MDKRMMLVAAVSGAAVGVVWAGPPGHPQSAERPAARNPLPPGPDGPAFSDNFDSYAPGSPLSGQGGWLLWDLVSPDAFVDSAQSASAPNSAVAVAGTDVVQVFDHTSGQWVAKVKTFTPSGAPGIGYFLMLNTFSHPYVGGGNWSLELDFNPNAAGGPQVISVNRPVSLGGPGNTALPLIFDQWVEVVVSIDLDADTFSVTYGGQPLATNVQWSYNAGPGAGVARIQCIDLYSTMAGFRWDDVALTPVTTGCYANCDGSTTPPVLNVADFTCFLTKFAAGDPYANCDGSTTPPVLNVADFTCFLTKFAGGC